jgi:hypothetical protein
VCFDRPPDAVTAATTNRCTQITGAINHPMSGRKRKKGTRKKLVTMKATPAPVRRA